MFGSCVLGLLWVQVALLFDLLFVLIGVDLFGCLWCCLLLVWFEIVCLT